MDGRASMKPIDRSTGVCRFAATLRMCALLVSSAISLIAPTPALSQFGIPGIIKSWHATQAAHFLEQATFGPSFAQNPSDPNYPVSVARVQALGYERWLNEQFGMPVLYPNDPAVPSVGTNYVYPKDPGTCPNGGICWSPTNLDSTTCGNICNRDNYTAYPLQVQFYTNALKGADQLRQRVAWALTQIFVVSQVDIHLSSWMTRYLQLFDRNAFGNFRQLLYDITLNPAMGQYLNMAGNVKTNVNENYAREVLQLFSIGLNKLNPDGTLRLDAQGNPIPTYGQDEITDFARVFTGWNLAAQLAPGIPNYRDPMVVASETRHDTDPKTLLDGAGLPGGQGAATELNEALDNIFNHPNVGPFIGAQLIQHLVTSNPGPDYVASVTSAFNTGTYTSGSGTIFGSGNRGDMRAVIAAILLDPEARTSPTSAAYGHLREPVLFITNTLRALGITRDAVNYTTDFVLGESFLPTNMVMGQDVFRSPTVFNYYPPDNQMSCATPPNCPLAPEFALQSTATALARINFIYNIVYHRMPTSQPNRPTGTWIDTTPFEAKAAGDAHALIDDLNDRLMHGAMTDAVRAIVRDAVTAIPDSDRAGLTARVREAMYLIGTASQYQVER